MQLPVVTPRQLVSYTASPRVATLSAVDPVEQSAIALFREVQQAAKKLEETNQLLEDLKGRFASQKATDVAISALQQRMLKYVAWYREEKLTDAVRHQMAQQGSERLQRGLALENELDELQADQAKLNALIVQLNGTSLFRGIKEQVTASVSSHKTPKQLYLELAQKILGYELKKIEPSTNQQLLTLLDEKQKKVRAELESLKKEAVYIVARGEWDMAQSKQLETAQRSILAQALNDRLEHEMGKLKKRTSRFLDAEKKYEEALVELVKKYQLLKVLPEAKQEDAVRLQVIDRLFAQYCRTPCTDFHALLSDSCPDDEPYLAHFLATRRFPPIPLVNVQAVECQRIFAQMAVRSTQSDMAALRPLPFGSSQVYACYWQERPWAVFKPTDGQPSMPFCKPGKQEALPLHFPPNEATQREWAAWSLIQPYFLSSIVALQHSNLCYH
ncbi:MAG: hypothetical protein KDK65_06180, partial [Chlamydiia bacterium]|nr:hypothetical protein [Chlamydiia bacterium]